VDEVIQGVSQLLTFYNIVSVVGGITIGITIGCLPGLGPGMAMAVALPITFYMSPLAGLCLLIGIYKGGIYGGSISAILINVPGTPDAAATLLDGYPLAKKGKAGKALQMAITASVTADTFSDIVLFLVAGTLASYAVRLAPPDIASIMFFALVVVGSVSGESLSKGLFMVGLGFLIAMVGIDPMMGVRRFTFGILQFDRGIELIPLAIGVFGISELLIQAEKKPSEVAMEDMFKISSNPDDSRLSWREYRGCLKAIARGSLIGTFIGALPGIGAVAASFLSYAATKNASKHPERFGTGELEGVAASESGNNATCGATFIPGSITAAMFMGGLILQGITPGPFMFERHARIIYGLYAGMIIANLANLILGSFGVKIFARIATIPGRIIYPIVLALCISGVYATNGLLFDVMIMFIFGVAGYFMRKFAFPVTPLLISFILEPMFERKFRQALIISHGSYKPFVTNPVSLIFILLTAFVIIYGWKRMKQRRIKNQKGEEG
jgi:putative tricarboxylic transport membrane protein